jgi:hypothetical protein
LANTAIQRVPDFTPPKPVAAGLTLGEGFVKVNKVKELTKIAESEPRFSLTLVSLLMQYFV